MQVNQCMHWFYNPWYNKGTWKSLLKLVLEHSKKPNLYLHVFETWMPPAAKKGKIWQNLQSPTPYSAPSLACNGSEVLATLRWTWSKFGSCMTTQSLSITQYMWVGQNYGQTKGWLILLLDVLDGPTGQGHKLFFKWPVISLFTQTLQGRAFKYCNAWFLILNALVSLILV